MKRKDIIAKLMKEGLTEKTLVIMSDKQLGMLAERLLSEQYTTTTIPTSPNAAGNKVMIPDKQPTTKAQVDAAKGQKKTIELYTGEMGEEKKPKWEDVFKKKPKGKKDLEVKEDMKLGAEKKEYSDKDKAIAASNLKIKAAIKDGKDYGDYTRLIKKLNDGKLPESTQKIIDGKKDINEWVDKVVGKHIHPFTSKGEIMELIDVKLNEQQVTTPGTLSPNIESPSGDLPEWLTYDEIKEAQPATKPITKPTTKPGTKPRPKTPYQPGPGINPNPKASSKKK